MSYRDWSDDDFQEFHDDAFQDIFNEIPGVADLSEDDLTRAEDLFEAGWLTWGAYDRDQLEDIREQFYDLVGLYSEDFDWDSFRELYDSV